MAWSALGRTVVWITCCLVLVACPPGTARNGVDDQASDAAQGKGPFRLDLERRSVSRAIGPEVHDPPAKKFVEIEIAEVFNPDKIRIAFEVHYQRASGEKVLLGTFGLFPPDKAGKFIVATRGKLRPGGVIDLSMQVLDEVGPEDEVRVTVKRIGFRAR